jgi:hypothetical protein
MKFAISILFSSLLFLSVPQSIFSQEAIGNVNIKKYGVSDAIKMMKVPTEKSDSDIDIPPHMQYIVALDQGGIVGPSTGLDIADPEYAMTMSAGDLTKTSWWSGSTLVQKINRCYGNGWVFFDIVSIADFKNTLSNTGKGFLTGISKEDSTCFLTFKWNKDNTKAKLEGYFDSLFSEVIGEFGGAIAGIATDSALMRVEIKLEPYWQWKFGISGKFNGASMDEKCCPPKEGLEKCSGFGKLGKGGACETISMACGQIKEEDLEGCAMYKRSNFLGLVGSVQIPGLANYLAYPLADKYGNETPYNSFYQAAIVKNGVNKLFEGVGKIQAKDEL